MKKYWVYILECSDKSYYTGVTNNIDRRFEEHQSGDDPRTYTYSRRPLKLVYFEFFQNIKNAIEYEKQIKGWTRAKKEALIIDNWERIKELAECKNETSHKNYKS